MENLEFKGTQEKWQVEHTDAVDGLDFYIRTSKGALGYYPAEDKDGHPVITWNEADANLIANAPQGLRVAVNTYLFLQKKAIESVSFALESEANRIDLRNFIASALDLPEQDVQETIEQAAMAEKTKDDVIKPYYFKSDGGFGVEDCGVCEGTKIGSVACKSCSNCIEYEDPHRNGGNSPVTWIKCTEIEAATKK